MPGAVKPRGQLHSRTILDASAQAQPCESRPMSKTVLPMIFGALSLASSLALAATPSHLYDLNNTLADSMGGPDLVSFGGSLTASEYQFGANQGLSLSGVLGSVYTIDTVVALDEVGGYRKLVDFKALGSDNGFYLLFGQLNFYPVDTGSANTIPNQWARFTLTRDAAGLTSGYVNGVQQWQFDDNGSQLATFSAAGNVAHFFIDDFVTAQGEASAGKVDYIALYDTALSAAEVGQISAVPEPTSYAMMLAGLAGLALWTKRRKH